MFFVKEIISIHALREEGDVGYSQSGGHAQLFLSTPSARRATRQAVRFATGRDISIHALREEGDERSSTTSSSQLISIHALREEGDFQQVPLGLLR